MIKNQIDNKKFFQIYVIMNLVFSITGFSILIFYIHGVITHDLNSIKHFIFPILGFLVILFVFKQFELIIKPSYIETNINEREIIVRTLSPNFRNGLRFIFMLKFVRYKRYLNELKLSQHEYNDYKLLIDKFGLRKRLILQKIQRDGIYETSEINISLLSTKKFTNLILSIDRLKGKINLN